MAFLLIILICYFTVAILRKTKIPNECLPLISGGLGLVFSLIAYYAIPAIVPDQSIGTTLLYGFFSGLAATGGNQVFKQAIKFIQSKYSIDIEVPTLDINTDDDNTPSKGDS